MIYQKALKQLNTVFPKFDIRPPTKKVTVRSLIQQVECPTFSNNDFAMLSNQQTAIKPLTKLSKIIAIWLQVLQSNQKARQQQQSKPINRKQIQQYDYLLMQSAQITGKTQFISFITQKSAFFSPSKSSSLTSKDYKQTYLCNQPQFYNPITLIPQQLYFKSLTQLTQKLGIYQQLIQHQIQNMDHLQQLYDMINNDELFKKKDNIFNRAVKYNFQRVTRFANQLEHVRKLVYLYQQGFVYGIARCYYLIYLSQKEIWEHRQNYEYLQEIQKFICDRPEQVFIKLYLRKITKPLLLLQNIRQSDLSKQFIEHTINTTQLQKITKQIFQLRQNIQNKKLKQITQPQFLQIYGQIQRLLLQTANQIKIDKNNKQCIQNKINLIKSQQEIVNMFIGNGQKLKDRKVLSIANSRLSNKSKMQRNSRINKSHIDINSVRNTIKSGVSNQKSVNKNNKIDNGEDVFILTPIQKSITPEMKQKIDGFVQDSNKYQKQCQDFILKIQPNFGYNLQDALNFKIQQLNALIEAGALSPAAIKQKQILMMLNRNLIKPQITQKNIQKIFKPQLRLSVLKLLSQKLIEMDYKNTKVIDNKQFETLPQNIKKFIQTRHSFLKQVNKQLDKVIGIATIISKLQTYQKYDICRYETYQAFLKVLLAEKETIAYQMSFRDQKNSKQTISFINNQIYQPFISSLTKLLPAPYSQAKQIVGVLDQIQFFVEFVQFTDKLIDNFVKDIEAQKDKQNIESIKREITRILGKWANDCTEKLKLKKQIFIYTKAQSQLVKISEIIKVCNNERSQIRDPIALQIVKILDKK